MKSYEITISYTAYATYSIEAENEEQAEEKVWRVYDPSDAGGESNIDSIEEVTA
jgi:hypothetical protein